MSERGAVLTLDEIQKLPDWQETVKGLWDADRNAGTPLHVVLLGSAPRLMQRGLAESRGGRRRQSSPKLIALNTALMSVHSGYTFAQARADRTFWGRLVATAVGAHLVNTASSAIRVNYWRQGDAEVDFVLERGRRRFLVDVESNGQITSGSADY